MSSLSFYCSCHVASCSSVSGEGDKRELALHPSTSETFPSRETIQLTVSWCHPAVLRPWVPVESSTTTCIRVLLLVEVEANQLLQTTRTSHSPYKSPRTPMLLCLHPHVTQPSAIPCTPLGQGGHLGASQRTAPLFHESIVPQRARSSTHRTTLPTPTRAQPPHCHPKTTVVSRRTIPQQQMVVHQQFQFRNVVLSRLTIPILHTATRRLLSRCHHPRCSTRCQWSLGKVERHQPDRTRTRTRNPLATTRPPLQHTCRLMTVVPALQLVPPPRYTTRLQLLTAST